MRKHLERVIVLHNEEGWRSRVLAITYFLNVTSIKFQYFFTDGPNFPMAMEILEAFLKILLIMLRGI
jgi:uncharacterized integral membrane protein